MIKSEFELRPRVDLYGTAAGHWLDRRVMGILANTWAISEDDLAQLKDDIINYLQELNHRKVAQLKGETNAKIK